MEITEVRIKLMEESEDRLRAFCSITIDNCFVVRDLKIIEGSSGPFVAMPSRKLTERCSKCGYKNHLRSNYCNSCGTRIKGAHNRRDDDANSNKLYADIAHPINQACRDIIQLAVVKEYQFELERAKVPGYKSRYDDEYADTTKVITSDEIASELNATDIDGVQLRLDSEEGVRKPHFSDPKKATDKANQTDNFGRGILE
jgi:stage V sporulation protein G